MERLFSGTVYEILPASNGIIFSYLNREFEEGMIEVSYKMISFDNRRLADVAKNIYMITKFGNNYKAVEKLCDNYITAKSIILPGGRVFVLHEDGTGQLIDADGQSLWKGTLVYRNFIPSDILLFRDGLWAVYEKGNVLIRYNITTMREELRIGGNTSPFDGPCDMFEEDGQIVVCNKNSKKISGVDIDNFSVTDYEEFEESVNQYVKVNSYRFVILESGLYIL